MCKNNLYRITVNNLLQKFRFPNCDRLLLRMPVETRSIRDSGAVGRFASVTLDFDEEEEQPEEDDVQTENACLRWLRKVCPCCCPKPKDDDITDTVDTGIDELENEDEVDDEKPVTGDGELDGNWRLGGLTIMLSHSMNARPTITLPSPYLCFHRTPPQSASDRPDERQIGSDPHRAPHKPLPEWQLYYPQRADVPDVDYPVATVWLQHWQTSPWA